MTGRGWILMCALAGALGLLLSGAESGWAQGSTSLGGTVSDSSGRLIQGVSLTLQNSETGAERSSVTDDIGGYHFPQIPPGKYRLRAELEGFRTSVREDIQIEVNTPINLNLKLDTGLVIQVDAFSTPSDATIGNTIQNSQIINLPLEARNAAGLLSLQPGVVYTGIVDPVFPDTRGGAVTGARSDQTNVMLDGVDVNDQQTGEAFKSVLPVTLDSIQEFRFVTSNTSATEGRSSGGQVYMVTRGGSNVFHGSTYEYHRNTATSANTFFNNSTIDPFTGRTIEKPKLIRNTFGASLSGPIDKNRVFFFLNFEDTITRREETQLRTAPSSTLRQGFLRYRDTTGNVVTMTPEQLRSADPLRIGPNPAVLALLQQYPSGNDPSQGGDGGLNFIGYRFNAPMKDHKPSYTARLDYTSADHKHNVFVRGSLANWKEDDLAPQFPGQPAARILLTNSKGIAAGDTWTINSRLINEARWGLTRQGLDFTGGSTGPGFDLRGIDSIRNFTSRNTARKLPAHNITDDLSWVTKRHTLQMGVNVRNIHNDRFTSESTYPSYRSNNGWMRNTGRTLLPAGIADSARTSFVQAQMALLGTISQISATYFVNLDGRAFPVPHLPQREYINNEFEWYVQDQWKLARNLTITGGLRYSYFAPPYEKNGFQVRADFDVNEWFAKRRDGAALGIPSNARPFLSFVLAGKANNAAPFFDPDKNNFAPRLALAWSPSSSSGIFHVLFGNPGQSSVRAGASLLYDRTGGMFPVTTDLSGAVGLSTSVATAPGTFDYDTAPRFNGFENLASIPLPPAPQAGFPSTPLPGLGALGFMVDTKLRTPYSTAFHAAISRALPGGLVVEAAYVGRVGRKLLAQADFAGPLLNFKDPKSGQTFIQAAGLLADLIDGDTAPANVPRIPFFENVFAPLATSRMTASQAVYAEMLDNAPSWMDALHNLDTQPGGATIYGPYTFFQPQFDWLPAWTNLGQSSYHSFQLAVRKRLGSGLQADFNYTLARAMDNASSTESEGQGAGLILNALDRRQGISYSNFDVRHQINSNFVLDLPAGRNRTFGANMNRALEAIVGNWRLTGIVHWRTGFPFAAASGNGFAFPTNYFVNGPPALKEGAALPVIKINKNAAGGPNIFADADQAYAAFDFTRPGLSGSRNVLHGPGFFSLDSGVQKVFKLAERQELQFRWETFNLTNTVNFDGRVYPSINRGIDFDLDRKSGFGRLRTLAGSPRVMQFALRYQF